MGVLSGWGGTYGGGRAWRVVLAGMPLFPAAYVAISRYADRFLPSSQSKPLTTLHHPEHNNTFTIPPTSVSNPLPTHHSPTHFKSQKLIISKKNTPAFGSALGFTCALIFFFMFYRTEGVPRDDTPPSVAFGQKDKYEDAPFDTIARKSGGDGGRDGRQYEEV